jgi:mono/diheme cytochrome c family protein
MIVMLKQCLALAGAILIAGFSLFAQDDKIARGKYLADEVARCQECHTPHLIGTGDLVKSAWLKGAQLEFVKVDQPAGWHSKAPDITSTSGLWASWGDDGMVKFLETARSPRGNKAGPPMPPYTLSHDDAIAIAAYLKSLK